MYELWVEPFGEDGRMKFSGVRGTLTECVHATDRFPKHNAWFKRINPPKPEEHPREKKTLPVQALPGFDVVAQHDHREVDPS